MFSQNKLPPKFSGNKKQNIFLSIFAMKHCTDEISNRSSDKRKIVFLESGESSYELGNSRPLYILSSNGRASGLLRRPLLFGKPVPRQTGHTSFPRPATQIKDRIERTL